MRAARLAVLTPLLAGCAAEAVSRASVFEEVWTTVHERFYDPTLKGVDWEAARERARPGALEAGSTEDFARAVNGMLAELATSHTGYFTREDATYYALLDVFWEALEPERRERLFPRGIPALPGIGILTEEEHGECFVRGVLEGGPAEAAGLLLGDRLLAVEEEPFRPVASFRGRAGRPTRIRVQRTSETGATLELSVVPEELLPRELFRRALQASARRIVRDGRDLAYAHVWSYAGEDMQGALKELLLAGPLHEADGLVLDLRGGFGGANPEYLNLFRPDLPRVSFIDREGRSNLSESSWTKPVVLLVDEGTTSGKEVFAQGFQHQHRGPIVGARSAGAVVGGRAFLLADGSLLYLAVLDVRVDGRRLEGVGVEPDVVVPFHRPGCAGRDPQLERALEVLSDLCAR